MIQLGDRGPHVRAWQRIVGVPYGKVDGVFGPGTERRVVAWQVNNEIAPDGVLGPACRAALRPDDLIKPYEGCRLDAYDDADGAHLFVSLGHRWLRTGGEAPRGYPTIGWGRRLYDTSIATCTQEQADDWLARHVRDVCLETLKKYNVEEPGKVCALSALCYNGGPGAVDFVSKHGFSEQAWNQWVHSMGKVDARLVLRRAEEYALWSDVST